MARGMGGASQGLRQLTSPWQGDHQNIPFLQLDVLNLDPIRSTFVVVVRRNREDFLGAILPGHVTIVSVVVISVGLESPPGTNEEEPGTL